MKNQYDFAAGRRGAVLPATGKTRITIRLDDDLLAWFRRQANAAGAGSYQSMINAALRSYVETEQEPFEATLRRVLREELPAQFRGTVSK